MSLLLTCKLENCFLNSQLYLQYSSYTIDTPQVCIATVAHIHTHFTPGQLLLAAICKVRTRDDGKLADICMILHEIHLITFYTAANSRFSPSQGHPGLVHGMLRSIVTALSLKHCSSNTSDWPGFYLEILVWGRSVDTCMHIAHFWQFSCNIPLKFC